MIERSVLGRLRADELYMERRRQNVANFGQTWLKPPGVTKTLFQMREERREAEEHAEAVRREMLAQELAEAAEREAEAQAQARAAQAAGGDDDDMLMDGDEEGGDMVEGEDEDGMGMGMGERDLDDEIPDADDGGFGFDGASDDIDEDEDDEDEDSDEEEESEEEESDEGGDTTRNVDDSSIAAGGSPVEHHGQYIRTQQQSELARRMAAERAAEERMREMMMRGRGSGGDGESGDLYGGDDGEDIDEEDQGDILDEDDLLHHHAHHHSRRRPHARDGNVRYGIDVEPGMSDLDMNMDANLDDDIPEAADESLGGYEHTDSEAELSSSLAGYDDDDDNTGHGHDVSYASAGQNSARRSSRGHHHSSVHRRHSRQSLPRQPHTYNNGRASLASRSNAPRSSLDISGFLSRDGSSMMGSSPHIRRQF